MANLSQEAFERARHFLNTRGRPLERALAAHAFDGGSDEGALRALKEYHNADGGFGHALEPDVRTPTSSALATSIGLGILKDLGVGPKSDLVRQAVGYLRQSLDDQTLVWRIVPEDANDFPHAPWWHDADGSLAQGFGGFAVNPRAELVAELWTYSSLVPSDWLAAVTESAVAAIESRELDPHDLICAVKLAESPALPGHFQRRVSPRVIERALALVAHDPDQWTQYNPQPLWFVSGRDSLLAGAFADILPSNLDFVVEQQTADGGWEPNWSWGDFYPDVWTKAKQDAAGMLTLKALRQLAAFGRITR